MRGIKPGVLAKNVVRKIILENGYSYFSRHYLCVSSIKYVGNIDVTNKADATSFEHDKISFDVGTKRIPMMILYEMV